MPITANYPSTPFLMLTILRSASKGEATIDHCVGEVTRFIETIRPIDLESHLPERVGSLPLLRDRLADAASHLEEAGLLACSNAHFAATQRGARLLAQNPEGIDDTVLEQFIEFRRFLARQNTASGPIEPTPDYKTGFNGFHDGAQLADNPYDPESATFLEWNAGWFEAFEEALDHHRDGQQFPHMQSS